MPAAGKPPRLCYLIISHRLPAQVARFARALRESDRSGAVVIRHDTSVSTIEPDLLRGTSEIHVLPPTIPVEWGEYSLVQVILESMRWSTENLSFDWLVLLSGDTYPCRPLTELQDLLERDGADAFLWADPPTAVPPDTQPDVGAGLYHYRYWALPGRLGRPPLPGTLKSRVLAHAKRTSRFAPFMSVKTRPRGLPTLVGYRQRRPPFPGPARKGSWPSLLRRSVVEELLRYVSVHPEYERYFRRTLLPEEGFFHTILYNTPGLSIRSGDLHFERWAARAPSPDVLHTEDLEAIVRSGAFFTRKVDQELDPELLDALDRRVWGAC